MVSFCSGDEWSQVAYVTFKDVQGADTALLLSVSYLVYVFVGIRLEQELFRVSVVGIICEAQITLSGLINNACMYC